MFKYLFIATYLHAVVAPSF